MNIEITIAKKRQYGFNDAWKKLDRQDKRYIERFLIFKCDWTGPIFINKRKGITPLSILEVDVIRQEFEKLGIDAFPNINHSID